MYVDAAYRSRLSSMVCHSSEPAKMAEPIQMPFGLRILVGPRNHVLDGGPDPSMESGNHDGEGQSIVM